RLGAVSARLIVSLRHVSVLTHNFPRFLFLYSKRTSSTKLDTLSLHDALPISRGSSRGCRHTPRRGAGPRAIRSASRAPRPRMARSEEHTSELQSRSDLVCRLLLEKKNQATACAHASAPTRPYLPVPARHHPQP